MGVNNNGGPSGERGSGNDAKGGELLPEGDGKADGGRGDQGDSGEGKGPDVGISQAERGNGGALEDGVSEDGDGKTDNQGNPLNADGTLKLEKITSIDELRDEDFSAPTRNIELPALPRNVDEAIGANGKPIIIKKNIFERNAKHHAELTAEDSRNILQSALYNANLYGQNQKAKRPYNWVVINTKDKEGNNRLVLIELSSEKENAEIVHWYYLRDESLETIKRQAEREGGHILILPSEASEEAGGLSSRTPDLSSGGKGNALSSEKQDADAKNGDGDVNVASKQSTETRPSNRQSLGSVDELADAYVNAKREYNRSFSDYLKGEIDENEWRRKDDELTKKIISARR